MFLLRVLYLFLLFCFVLWSLIAKHSAFLEGLPWSSTGFACKKSSRRASNALL